jgi:hypothetical protein
VLHPTYLTFAKGLFNWAVKKGILIESQLQDTFVFLSERSGMPFRYDSLWATVQRLCKLADTIAVCT